MNNNAVRTVLGGLTLTSTVVAAVAGCTGDNPLTPVVEAVQCSASWLTPTTALWAVMGFTGLELAIKALRPGGVLGGLFGATATVNDSGAPGTATASHVASNFGPQ